MSGCEENKSIRHASDPECHHVLNEAEISNGMGKGHGKGRRCGHGHRWGHGLQNKMALKPDHRGCHHGQGLRGGRRCCHQTEQQS
ncbi:hypothetical protein VA7868_03941 [Vibrio aerogenes CECT 7868]|uniref:Uncharacterized protein n=1 Tax=Vibrio aerogenes CECT 7868 TaxID=1216006 RepID=A0A1M6C668_9VIBR|nr:hypothetical protein VA7868_03941 [Vibrio aerogenes CECT 7868]